MNKMKALCVLLNPRSGFRATYRAGNMLPTTLEYLFLGCSSDFLWDSTKGEKVYPERLSGELESTFHLQQDHVYEVQFPRQREEWDDAFLPDYAHMCPVLLCNIPQSMVGVVALLDSTKRVLWIGRSVKGRLRNVALTKAITHKKSEIMMWCHTLAERASIVKHKLVDRYLPQQKPKRRRFWETVDDSDSEADNDDPTLIAVLNSRIHVPLLEVSPGDVSTRFRPPQEGWKACVAALLEYQEALRDAKFCNSSTTKTFLRFLTKTIFSWTGTQATKEFSRKFDMLDSAIRQLTSSWMHVERTLRQHLRTDHLVDILIHLHSIPCVEPGVVVSYSREEAIRHLHSLSSWMEELFLYLMKLMESVASMIRDVNSDGPSFSRSGEELENLYHELQQVQIETLEVVGELNDCTGYLASRLDSRGFETDHSAFNIDDDILTQHFFIPSSQIRDLHRLGSDAYSEDHDSKNERFETEFRDKLFDNLSKNRSHTESIDKTFDDSSEDASHTESIDKAFDYSSEDASHTESIDKAFDDSSEDASHTESIDKAFDDSSEDASRQMRNSQDKPETRMQPAKVDLVDTFRRALNEAKHGIRERRGKHLPILHDFFA